MQLLARFDFRRSAPSCCSKKANNFVLLCCTTVLCDGSTNNRCVALSDCLASLATINKYQHKGRVLVSIMRHSPPWSSQAHEHTCVETLVAVPLLPADDPWPSRLGHEQLPHPLPLSLRSLYPDPDPDPARGLALLGLVHCDPLLLPALLFLLGRLRVLPSFLLLTPFFSSRRWTTSYAYSSPVSCALGSSQRGGWVVCGDEPLRGCAAIAPRKYI